MDHASTTPRQATATDRLRCGRSWWVPVDHFLQEFLRLRVGESFTVLLILFEVLLFFVERLPDLLYVSRPSLCAREALFWGTSARRVQSALAARILMPWFLSFWRAASKSGPAQW